MKTNWMSCDKSITNLLGLIDDDSLLRDAIRYIESKNKSVVEDAFIYAKNQRDRGLNEI